MTEILTVHAATNEAARVLAPRPFPGFGRKPVGFTVRGGCVTRTLTALNSCQQAYLVEPAGDSIRLEYVFEDGPAQPPPWTWQPVEGRYTRSSPELDALVADLSPSHLDPQARIDLLARHVVAVFEYGHGTGRFTDGHRSVPVLNCGTTRGSCVDIHTYFTAALLSAGITAAYVAGVFLESGAESTDDMHCWVAICGRDHPTQWDLSHVLLAGNEPSPGLDHIAGSRVGLSNGRGLRFEVEGKTIEVSHFGQPVAVHTGELLSIRAAIRTGT